MIALFGEAGPGFTRQADESNLVSSDIGKEVDEFVGLPRLRQDDDGITI